jgi:hypothetical protein
MVNYLRGDAVFLARAQNNVCRRPLRLDADQAFETVERVRHLRVIVPGVNVAGMQNILHDAYVCGLENQGWTPPSFMTHLAATSDVV